MTHFAFSSDNVRKKYSWMNREGRNWVAGSPTSRRSMQSYNYPELLPAWKEEGSFGNPTRKFRDGGGPSFLRPAILHRGIIDQMGLSGLCTSDNVVFPPPEYKYRWRAQGRDVRAWVFRLLLSCLFFLSLFLRSEGSSVHANGMAGVLEFNTSVCMRS